MTRLGGVLDDGHRTIDVIRRRVAEDGNRRRFFDGLLNGLLDGLLDGLRQRHEDGPDPEGT